MVSPPPRTSAKAPCTPLAPPPLISGAHLSLGIQSRIRRHLHRHREFSPAEAKPIVSFLRSAAPVFPASANRATIHPRPQARNVGSHPGFYLLAHHPLSIKSLNSDVSAPNTPCCPLLLSAFLTCYRNSFLSGWESSLEALDRVFPADSLCSL